MSSTGRGAISDTGGAAAELVPTIIRELDLAPGIHPRDMRWLSATSGLVCIGQHAYVVADDEHHLGHFTLDGIEPVSLIRLFEGNLPLKKGKRKKEKPDLECIALLPSMPLYPHGALLALGSGSRPTRNRATLLALDASGEIQGPPMQVDLTGLYEPLRTQFADLNIEGAYPDGTAMHLLQRGNKGSAISARISYAWSDFSRWLLGDTSAAPHAATVQLLDLGMRDGVPLTPTDGTALADGKWLFCAVAENTVCSFDDGACLSSLVGIADAHGKVERLQHLHGNPKVEGIALEPGSDPAGKELHVLLVTDDDDPDRASRLLRCTLFR
jgi:hypothetical protein